MKKAIHEAAPDAAPAVEAGSKKAKGKAKYQVAPGPVDGEKEITASPAA